MLKTLPIKKVSPKILFGLFLLIGFISCTEKSEEHIKNAISESVKAHGGMKNYKKLKAISFTKTTRLFKEDGSLESEGIQKQTFQLHPTELVEIVWKENSKIHKIFYDGVRSLKTISGQVITDSTENAKALLLARGASYVFLQPFKLMDDNVILKDEGRTVLNDSVDVSVVAVSYKNDTADSDKWKYYFNDDDLLVANSVKHQGRLSLIENLEFQKVSGLIFNKHRKSYMVDSLLNKSYLRAEYFYKELATSE